MKLNYRRTVLVGFAFFLISAFWSAYDPIIPLILTNRFSMNQTLSGFIMALDNILAVLLLPLFGSLSDRTHTKVGRRTPYIFVGTVIACLLLPLLGEITELALFIVVLLGCLLAMSVFRSPAVALMPDVTVKSLRSKGNAVINLMGTAGGMIALLLASVWKTGTAGNTEFTGYLLSVAVVMATGLLVFLLTVREPEWARDAARETKKLGLDEKAPDESAAETAGDGKLSKGERLSLILLLASVALWYIGYNAITSKYSVYAANILHVSYSTTLLVAQAAAIVAFLPVGMIASKIGRKKTILAGVVMLAVAFGTASFLKEGTPEFVMYLLFALAGIGWATINVNSFPMVVELASHGNVGKFTGYYYTASMLAQVVTPILSGFLVDRVGWWIFFPYAAFFATLAFVTMLFVRHGDAKPEMPKDALSALGEMEND